MAMEDVVILGASGHAKVVIDILETMQRYRILGVTTPDAKEGAELLGYPVLGDDRVLDSLRAKGLRSVAIGVGGWTENGLRKRVYDFAKAAGFHVVSAIAPSAVISPRATIGDGCCIFPGVIVNVEARIGANVIVATGSTVDHETTVEDHVLISAGVDVGANVRLGEGCLLAIGSTVTSGKTIGRHALVAAGAVVVKDVPPGARVMGVPAREMRSA